MPKHLDSGSGTFAMYLNRYVRVFESSLIITVFSFMSWTIVDALIGVVSFANIDRRQNH